MGPTGHRRRARPARDRPQGAHAVRTRSCRRYAVAALSVAALARRQRLRRHRPAPRSGRSRGRHDSHHRCPTPTRLRRLLRGSTARCSSSSRRRRRWRRSARWRSTLLVRDELATSTPRRGRRRRRRTAAVDGISTTGDAVPNRPRGVRDRPEVAPRPRTTSTRSTRGEAGGRRRGHQRGQRRARGKVLADGRRQPISTIDPRYGTGRPWAAAPVAVGRPSSSPRTRRQARPTRAADPPA